MRTFVIGDLHGHIDRLELLLMQEELIEPCPTCDRSGQVPRLVAATKVKCDELVTCPRCKGNGWARAKRDEVEIVIVGDICHLGHGASPTGDMLTLKAAIDWADVLLWGNHDRAAVDAGHQFSGYQSPGPEIRHLYKIADMKLAYAAHGFLITHAGLHEAFRYQVPEAGQEDMFQIIKDDPVAFADWINEICDINAECSPSQNAVRDAVSRQRGGGSPAGGILWRDIDEKLYMGFRQIFGHSADRKHQVRYCTRKNHTRNLESVKGLDWSYCVDIGGKGDRPGDNCLAAIYLPDETIVRIDLDQAELTGYPTL